MSRYRFHVNISSTANISIFVKRSKERYEQKTFYYFYFAKRLQTLLEWSWQWPWPWPSARCTVYESCSVLCGKSIAQNVIELQLETNYILLCVTSTLSDKMNIQYYVMWYEIWWWIESLFNEVNQDRLHLHHGLSFWP